MSNIIEFNKFINSEVILKKEVEFYMLIGIPASGKTYYCNKNFNSNNTKIISSDILRAELFGDLEYSSHNNKTVFEIVKKEIVNSLKCGYNVVLDATNTNSIYRKRILKEIKNDNIKTIALIFDTSLKVCIERNNMRSLKRRVPLDIMLAMSKFDKTKILTENFDIVKTI